MSRRPADLERAAKAIEEFLGALGHDDAHEPELRGTGMRVAEAFAHELLAGYAEEPRAILGAATASDAPGFVLVAHVPITIVCPHHLLPASGVAHVGYLPQGRVVGLGALGRLVLCFARRLTLQEDFCRNVAESLVADLGARGALCAADLSPACVTARGERHHGARSYTLATAGLLATDASAREEHVRLVPPARTTADPPR